MIQTMARWAENRLGLDKEDARQEGYLVLTEVLSENDSPALNVIAQKIKMQLLNLFQAEMTQKGMYRGGVPHQRALWNPTLPRPQDADHEVHCRHLCDQIERYAYPKISSHMVEFFGFVMLVAERDHALYEEYADWAGISPHTTEWRVKIARRQIKKALVYQQLTRRMKWSVSSCLSS